MILKFFLKCTKRSSLFPSNHPHIQMFSHGLQGSGNAVNTGGVVHVGQPVYFLRRGVETARKLGRPDTLGDHLIEQQHLGR